jgi:hypothetical protein
MRVVGTMLEKGARRARRVLRRYDKLLMVEEEGPWLEKDASLYTWEWMGHCRGHAPAMTSKSSGRRPLPTDGGGFSLIPGPRKHGLRTGDTAEARRGVCRRPALIVPPCLPAVGDGVIPEQLRYFQWKDERTRTLIKKTDTCDDVHKWAHFPLRIHQTVRPKAVVFAIIANKQEQLHYDHLSVMRQHILRIRIRDFLNRPEEGESSSPWR